MEVHVRRSVDLELLVDSLIHLLLVQTLTMDSHFLSREEDTETGSLIFLTPYGLLVVMVEGINITYLEDSN